MAMDFFVGPGGYSTINEALALAKDFDIIHVATGSYNETLVITKSISLLGAATDKNPRQRNNREEESILSSSNPKGIIQIYAANVVVDGFTIEYNLEGPGIYTSPHFSGYKIYNNILQHNCYGLHLNSNGAIYTHIKQNYFNKNNQPSAISGNGIYTATAASNIFINNNVFTHHQPAASVNLSGEGADSGPANIIISSNEMLSDNSILLTNTTNVSILYNKMTNTLGSAIFLGGGTRDTTVEGNILVNSLTNGIYINDFFSGTANRNIRIHNNSFIGNLTAALNITPNSYQLEPSESKLNAVRNWWQGPIGTSCIADSSTLIDPEGIVETVPYLSTPSGSSSRGIEATRISSKSTTTTIADSKESAILTELGLKNDGYKPMVVGNISGSWPVLKDYPYPNNSILLGEPDFLRQQLEGGGGETKYFSTIYYFNSLEEHLILITTFSDNCHKLFLEERHKKTGELISSITPKGGLSAGDMLPNMGILTDLEPSYSWQQIFQYSKTFTPSSIDNALTITFEITNYYSKASYNPAVLAFKADIFKVR